MPDPRSATCPHCGARLLPLGLPDAVFEHAHDLACFNDACPYFVRGWTWMEHRFGITMSYRFRLEAETGQPSPLAAFGPRTPAPRRGGALPILSGEEHP